jgi:hypothetical protein
VDKAGLFHKVPPLDDSRLAEHFGHEVLAGLVRMQLLSPEWAEMIRKVYEVDPLLCPQCGGQMRVIAFLTDSAVVDRIINHLKLTFVADKPPPPHVAYQEFLMAAESWAEYFS